jgi:hypothetical protein
MKINQHFKCGGSKLNPEIEHIARAFHDAQDDGIAWDSEPEIIKEEFRTYARNAIALFAEYKEMKQLEAFGSERTSRMSEAA